MSGFGNYLGATMGTSTNEEGRSGAVYDNAFVTNSNYPKRAALIGEDGKFIQLDSDLQDENKVAEYQPNSDLLGEVPGLISDNSTYLEVQDKLSGPESLNWESKSFIFMRKERDSLNPGKIEQLGKDWTEHGETLKTTSKDFKETVNKTIEGKWSGESAAAASVFDEAQVAAEASTGKKAANDREGVQRTFLHRGLAERDFERRFQLADYVIVTDAALAAATSLGTNTAWITNDLPILPLAHSHDPLELAAVLPVATLPQLYLQPQNPLMWALLIVLWLDWRKPQTLEL